MPVALRTSITAAVCTAALAAALGAGVFAQAPGRAGGPPAVPAAQTAQSTAPYDITGNWVAVVTEDWRWRMVTPPKGDYSSLPLLPDGVKVADTWTPVMDGSCLAFGMGGLLRQPTRVRVAWQDPQTLKLETDNGVQTRLFHFDPNTRKPIDHSLQGFTAATWERQTRGIPGAGRGAGGPGGGGGGGGALAPPGPQEFLPGGGMKATTTMLRSAWLRKNGVAYSDNAEITELIDVYPVPNGDQWMTVSTIVHDPKYYFQDVVVSSHFKKEPDGSKWNPTPCKPVS